MKPKTYSQPEMKKTTTLDYIILGLIQNQNLSGYRIRKTFEDTALGNFGGSPGTIYPALKRLEHNGLIFKKKLKQSKKSEYSITESGLTYLKDWLELSPSTDEIKKNPEVLVLKFAFMDGLISPQQQIEHLKHMKKGLSNYLNELEGFFDKESKALPPTGKIAFQHGLMSYRTHLDWCDHALASLQGDY